MKKNKQDTKVSDIFTDDINNLTEHLNIVIEAHNKQLDEIERLNNIINELEKFCNSRTKSLYGVVGTLWQEYQDILDKLQELKENNK